MRDNLPAWRVMAEHSFRARIALGISGQAFARIMFAVSTLVLVPLLISAWGMEGYGQWIALTALTSYLGLSNFGLVTTAANDVVIAIGAQDEARARRSFQNSVCLAVYVVLPIIALVLAMAWTAPLGRWLHLTQMGVHEVHGILVCSGITLWFQTLRGLLVAALYATGSYGLAYALQGCAKLLEILGLCLLVLVLGGGQLSAASWIAAVALVELGVVAWLAHRSAPWARLDLTAFDKAWLRGQLKPALGFMISNFATQGLLLQGPRVVLGALLGGTAVAVYAIYGTAMRFVDQLLLSLVLPLEVEFAHSTGRGDHRNVDRLIVLGTHVSWLLFALVCAGLLLFGPLVFRVWTAGRADFSYALMSLFMLLSACNLIGRVGLHALISTNRLFAPSCAILIVAALGLTLGAALTRPLGVHGMVLGNAAGELVNSLIVTWVVALWLGKTRAEALQDLLQIGPSIRTLRAQSRHAWYRLRPGT